MEETLRGICATTKLERDRAETVFREKCGSLSDPDTVLIYEWIFEVLNRSEEAWETKYGALTAARILLSVKTGSEDAVFQNLRFGLMRCLEDAEFRVRIAAGECLGVMCAVGGLPFFMETAEVVKAGIRANLERCEEGVQSETSSLSSSPVVEVDVLRRKLNADDIFHDTAGWKSLETWMRCLHCMVENVSAEQFQNFEDPEFFPLLFDALAHTNRFVRETGFQLLGVSVAASRGHVQTLEVARQLASGLADNWSQVRMSASVATRRFLECYGLITSSGHNALRMASESAEAERREVLDLLLPPMCLNRYYVAEGVRIFSLETWRRCAAGDGPALVGRHLTAVVEFYLRQSEAENHAVREAACSCLAELATKVDSDLVRPMAASMMEALLVCFTDDSWPVRDTACLAASRLFAAFPGDLAASLPTLMPLFFTNLRDGVPSVRQGAAGAVRTVVEALGGADGSVENEVMRLLDSGLREVHQQTEQSQAGSEGGRATFGVVEDSGRFENQVMYSCGSLAPKMKRGGAKKGGCHDGSFSRPPQPWEVTDGAVHLFTELSHLSRLHQRLIPLLHLISDAAALRHFPHHVYLLETIFQDIPIIARNLGKRQFKAHLEEFLDQLGYGATSDNALAAAAAQSCIQELARLLGPGILRGRIEMFNPALLPKLNHFIH